MKGSRRLGRAALSALAASVLLAACQADSSKQADSTKQAHSSNQCGAMPCRSNGAPYVTDKGAIVIYPGEQFVIALKIENGKIVNAGPNLAGGQSANAIEIDIGMMLTIVNHLPSAIKDDATMKAPDGKLVYTSSCPVDAGLSNFEHWAHPIKFLELSNFRFQDGGACE